MTMETANVLSACDDDLGIDKVFMQKLGIDNQYDASIPNDFVWSFT
jgi:hypothetical protein